MRRDKNKISHHVRSFFLLTLIATATLLCLNGDAHAQGFDPKELFAFANNLKTLTNSDAYRDAVDARAREQLTALPKPCPDAETKRLPSVNPYGLLKLDADGKMIGGALGQPYEVKGCGDLTQINVIVAGDPEKGMQTELYVPGVVTGNPKVILPVMAEVAKATLERTPECHKRSIINTALKGFDGDVVKDANVKGARPFTQIWTVWACDKVLDVPVHYVPGPKGTDVRVTADEVRDH